MQNKQLADLLNEIRVNNMANLHLASELIKLNPVAAQHWLGCSDEAIKWLADLKSSQIKELSRVDTLLFGFRFKSQTVLESLAKFADGDTYSLPHAMLKAMNNNDLECVK